MRRLHAAGERDSKGGEEGGEKESSKAERLLGLGYGRRRVRRWSGKSSKGRKLFTRSEERTLGEHHEKNNNLTMIDYMQD